MRIGRNRNLAAVMAASAAGICGLCSLLLLGKFYDQYGVLHAHTGENHEPNLGEDVVVELAEINARNAAQQAHRHDQNNRQRQREAFVFGRVREKNEQDAKREDIERRVAGRFLLKGQFGPFIAKAGGKILPGKGLHDLDGLSAAYPRGAGAIDLGGRIKVVSIDSIGIDNVLQIDDGS